MLLQAGLSESLQAFKDKTSSIISEMKLKTQEFIKFVNEQNEQFYERLKELAIREQALFEERILANEGDGDQDGEDNEEFNAQLELLGEKEPLVSLLDSSKEFMDQ